MIKVIVYYIAKTNRDLSDKLCGEFVALCGQFGVKLEFINLFCKAIALSQMREASIAQKSYTKEFFKTFKENQYRIALSPNAKELDSFGFAKTLQNQGNIAFFIGGAYGLEENFLKSCHAQISLSKLTFSHKIAKITLSEQIYRAFCLIHNHPYHK